MGFLCEYITLAYFVFLGDRSSTLSLSVGFSELLASARYMWTFSVGQEGHASQGSDILIASEDQISGGNILWLSSLN